MLNINQYIFNMKKENSEIKRFIRTLEEDELVGEKQSLLLSGESSLLGSGANGKCTGVNMGCTNEVNCAGSKNGGCSNAKDCSGTTNGDKEDFQPIGSMNTCKAVVD